MLTPWPGKEKLSAGGGRDSFPKQNSGAAIMRNLSWTEAHTDVLHGATLV